MSFYTNKTLEQRLVEIANVVEDAGINLEGGLDIDGINSKFIRQLIKNIVVIRQRAKDEQTHGWPEALFWACGQLEAAGRKP